MGMACKGMKDRLIERQATGRYGHLIAWRIRGNVTPKTLSSPEQLNEIWCTRGGGVCSKIDRPARGVHLRKEAGGEHVWKTGISRARMDRPQ